MTCIDNPVQYRSTSYLPNRKAEELYEGLNQITRFYNGAGHTIKMIHMDNEFKPIMDEVKDEMDINMNYTNAGDHVPKAERNNQLFKNRIRMKYH